MEKSNIDIQKIINSQTKLIKRKNAEIEQIEVSLDRDKKGKYLTRLTIFMRGRTLSSKGSNYNLQKSIKKSFQHLKSILDKKKNRRYTKVSLSFGEAA